MAVFDPDVTPVDGVNVGDDAECAWATSLVGQAVSPSDRIDSLTERREIVVFKVILDDVESNRRPIVKNNFHILQSIKIIVHQLAIDSL